MRIAHLRPREDACPGMTDGIIALNTPLSHPPRCWSAPDRGSARSCRASAAKSFRSRAERQDRISCSLRSRRGISSSYSASPFRVMRSRNSRRSSSFSTRSTSCRSISAVTARLMVDLWVRVQCGDVLRAAGIVAEAERRQHPPFRNIEPVALLIFAGQRGADLGRQPVQPKRHETEEVESAALLRTRSVRASRRSTPDRVRAGFRSEDAFGKNRSNLS